MMPLSAGVMVPVPGGCGEGARGTSNSLNEKQVRERQREWEKIDAAPIPAPDIFKSTHKKLI